MFTIVYNPNGSLLSKSFICSCVKSWKHDFEITGDPKGPPSGSTFLSGSEAPDS